MNSEENSIEESTQLETSMEPSTQLETSMEPSTQLTTYNNNEADLPPIIRKEINTPIHVSPPKNKLVVLTWNIWFDSKSLKDRTLRIVQNIKQLAPDLICLQEATEQSYTILKSRLVDYHIFQIFIEEGNPYGTCILCKKSTIDVIEPYYYDFPNTQMGRRVVGCEIKLQNFPDKSIHVLTTHLESLWENMEYRNMQFETIKEVIKDVDNLILAGDLNICSEKEPIVKNIGSTNLSDVWRVIGCPTSIKYTYDGKLNSNIKGSTQGRLDRILYRLSFNHRLHQVRLIGLNSTSPSILEPPSDHFGLYAEFLLK